MGFATSELKWTPAKEDLLNMSRDALKANYLTMITYSYNMMNFYFAGGQNEIGNGKKYLEKLSFVTFTQRFQPLEIEFRCGVFPNVSNLKVTTSIETVEFQPDSRYYLN